MRNIRIIRGAYGHRPDGSTLTATKTASDPPFEVSDSEAARLVEMGIAKYTDAPAVSPAEKPEYDVSTNANTLKALMKAVGLAPKVGMKKEEMVAALDEFYDAASEDDEPDPDDEGGDEDEEDGDGDGDGDSDSEGDEKLPELGAEEPLT